MSWILGAAYCGFLWLVFAKLRLLKLSFPIAVVAGAVGPGLILALLFCAQFYHPFSSDGRVFQEVVPIVPQLRQSGRVLEVTVAPNSSVKSGDVLFSVDPVPYQNAVTRLKSGLDEAKQSQLVALASVDLAQASLDRSTANLEFATRERERIEKLFTAKAASAQEFDLATNRFSDADAAMKQATASLAQSRYSVDLAKARIAQTETQLADAEYDLSQTTVIAPGDGFVTNLQLRKGMLVGGPGSTSVMSFVLNTSESVRGVVVATFNQKNYMRIKSGQYAEIALHGYPGQIFTGRVLNTIDVSGAGQLSASGILPSELGSQKSTTFAVRIKLDRGDDLRLPGGSQAEVAVYTDDVQIAGIPVMFIVRTKSWLRYIM
jgi:multidrug resistance efflux pump